MSTSHAGIHGSLWRIECTRATNSTSCIWASAFAKMVYRWDSFMGSQIHVALVRAVLDDSGARVRHANSQYRHRRFWFRVRQFYKPFVLDWDEMYLLSSCGSIPSNKRSYIAWDLLWGEIVPTHVVSLRVYKGMRLLQTESIESNRPLPDWAKDIASSRIINYSPKNKEDSVRFLAYAALLCKVYMKVTDRSHSIHKRRLLLDSWDSAPNFISGTHCRD